MRTAIIKDMIGELETASGFTIIKADQKGDQPPLPYAVYKVTTPFIKGRGRGNRLTGLDGQGNPVEVFASQPLTTISFSVFAADTDESRELAIELRSWFEFEGEEYLLNNEIAVRTLGAVGNRTTFLTDDYEYKHGFDVQLRKEVTRSRLIPIIENTNTNGGT